MKKAVITSIMTLTALGLFAGCIRYPLASEVMAGEDTEEIQESEELVSDEIQNEVQDDSEDVTASMAFPEIDTSVQIQAGSRIAVVSKSTKGEFWNMIQKGMEQGVRDINEAYGFSKDDQITMTFEGPSNEADVSSQINILDAVVAENPEVLCISAIDMESCQAQLEAARDNGIPVIAFDSNVSTSQLVRAFRATDNRAVGDIGADKLAEAMGESGKVVVFSAQEKTQSVQERVEGFRLSMMKYSGISVEEIVYADQVEDMASAMEETLEKYPDLKGVFCTNADISDLYLSLDQDEERTQPVLVGVDATTAQQEAIRDGREAGVVSQNPYAIGYQTVWTALVAAIPEEADKIERNILIEPEWIDASNIDDPVYSDYIYS